MITDYASLKTAIADLLNRDDLDAAIGTFIAVMEAQTEEQLRLRQMLARMPFDVGNEYEDLPADFLETRAFSLNTVPATPLTFATLDSMEVYKRDNPGTGKPTQFSIVGEQFQFLKVPDTTYSATLLYYQKIPRLSDTQTSNWLLQARPDLYLYGAALNSAPYLKEDARIQTWSTFYQNAIDSMQVADDRAQTASNNLKAKARTF